MFQDQPMNKKQKRIALFFILVIIICGIGLTLKFFHIGIFHIKSSTPESEFVNKEKLRNSAPNALSFDFEVDPKSGDQKELYKGIAHSGIFSAKVFGKNSFSIVIERKAGDIGMENMKAVALSAWVYVFPGKNDVESSLVFSGSTNGINLTWQGVTLHGNDLPRGKWFKISGLFNLSEIIFKPETKLQFYFWNNSANDILMDDLFVAFGGPGERRGDSTFVDMTKGMPFVSKFNSPPYPFHYFMKDEINNENSKYLVNHEDKKEGEILSSDQLITGHFASVLLETEDILVIKKEGKTDLFIFDKTRCLFQKATNVFPADAIPGTNLKTILKGNFTNKNNDQLIGIGLSSAFLLSPEKNKDINPSSGQIKSGAQLKWNSIRISLSENPEIKGTVYSAADLNGDKITELLAVHPDGSWKIYSFSTNPLHPVIIESGKTGSVAEWNEMKMEMKITVGKFIQKYSQDVILTVFREKGKHGYSFMISRFDQGSRSFISYFPEKQRHLGKTTGSDTLKPTDEFFVGNFDNSGVQKIFRYNRDWRYDLKEIRFNDSTFQVLANIDFTGYEKDHNPKYFESLKIFSGSFLKQSQSSLLLIQKNPANKDFMGLPETIQIYSFSKTE
jgi:hypothetical protein